MSVKVLFVDDEPMMLTLGEEALGREPGLEVLTAASGEEALSLCASEHPDLVFLDIRMPGKDGWEVCRQLKGNEATQDIKVIVLTAYAQQATQRKAETQGADGYMTKPFSPADLVRKTMETLEV